MHPRTKFREKPDPLNERLITDETIDSLKGMLKRKSGTKPVTQMLLEAHASENLLSIQPFI